MPPTASGACRPRHPCWFPWRCQACAQGARVGRSGPGLAARWADGHRRDRGSPRGLSAPLWPCAYTHSLCPGPWGTSQSACSPPWCSPRSRCWTSEALAKGASRKWKEREPRPGLAVWDVDGFPARGARSSRVEARGAVLTTSGPLTGSLGVNATDV